LSIVSDWLGGKQINSAGCKLAPAGQRTFRSPYMKT